MGEDAKIEDKLIESAGIKDDKKKGLFKDLFNRFMEKFKSNELSHDDLRMQLARMVDAMDIPAEQNPVIHYIHKVFDDYMIIRQESSAGIKLYYQEFKIENEKAEMVGQKREVLEKTSFVDASASGEDKTNKNKKEVNNMADKCCKELIDALISNEATQFSEDDRKWLEEMPEEQIKKLNPVEKEDKAPTGNEDGKTDTPEDDKDKKVDTKTDIPATEDEPVTAEKYIESAPPEIQEVLNSALKMQNARKGELIKQLLANKRNKFTEDQLKKKDLEELENLAELADVVVDFSLNSGSNHQNSNDDEKIPPTPEIDWAAAAGTKK